MSISLRMEEEQKYLRESRTIKASGFDLAINRATLSIYLMLELKLCRNNKNYQFSYN